jgi:hypothetical protein
LTREEFDHAVHDLLGIEGRPSRGLAEDEKVAAFDSNAVSPVSRLVVEQYLDVADGLAREAVANLDSILECDRAVSGDESCAQTFVRDFGRRVYRRPLDAVGVERYRAVCGGVGV